jgi:hypothetical protein
MDEKVFEIVFKSSAILILLFGSLSLSSFPFILKKCKKCFKNAVIDHILEIINGFAGKILNLKYKGGVLLSGAFLHLLVESNHLIEESIGPKKKDGDEHLFSYANLICSASLFIIYSIEQVNFIFLLLVFRITSEKL